MHLSKFYPTYSHASYVGESKGIWPALKFISGLRKRLITKEQIAMNEFKEQMAVIQLWHKVVLL